MIAVCPSCHDNIHHGKIEISDETLYRWKSIERPSMPQDAHLYVEPSDRLRVMTGSFCISTNNPQMAVFDLSPFNQFRFRILDGDILQLTVKISTLDGAEVLHVVENHVRPSHDPNVEFDAQAGHVRVTVPMTARYIPEWVVQQMKSVDPEFGADGRITVLDLEVLRPGLVRVEGFWPDKDVTIVITRDAFVFCDKHRQNPLPIMGAGEDLTYRWKGPINSALFRVVRN